MRENEVLKLLGKYIEKEQPEKVQEIRMRVGKPIIFVADNTESVTRKIVERDEFTKVLDYFCKYSLYAFENEIRQGFITIEGGHRVGISGQVLMEQGEIKNFKNITSMNIRIAHEMLNCADAIVPYITSDNQILNTLIVSPPRCGKTTLLRDLIRQVSNGNHLMKGCTVGVVDERSELGGSYQGIPQNELGILTDVLDACPKSKGMMMLIRSMAPKVIAVDEIGGAEDIHAIRHVMNCGCKILATVHSGSMEELRRKPLFEELIKEKCFDRYVVLGSKKRIGEIQGIYDSRGSVLYQECQYA